MEPINQELSNFVYSERTESFSQWKNTNNVVARFKLLTDKKRKGIHKRFGADCQASCFLVVEIQPGQTKSLPSEYDQAIRKVSPKTGQVVGGLCPWLTKIGEEDVVVHKSLDYKNAIETEQAFDMVAALAQEDKLKAALATLQASRETAVAEIETKKVGRPKKDLLT